MIAKKKVSHFFFGVAMGEDLGMKKIKMGSATLPVPGFDVKVFDENGVETKAGDTGSIVIKLPLPPGCLPTLWNDDERYKNSYGYR